ncbi:lipopolysaccharide biosynthesis protein [Micromonospora sp. FIMYZ51]|uniref:lipopolysaccharide biosynthesis protein n=1 Tax=Micromonospora sp. FIMYZ51 TaxID=3051832 RepID=UPI00311F14AB
MPVAGCLAGHGSAPDRCADEAAGETRRSARAASASLLGAAVNGLLGFLLVVVITRGYGASGSGAFFAAIGVVTVAAAICTLGAETGLIWLLPRRRTGVSGDAARLLPVALIPPLTVAGLVGGIGLLAAEPLADRLLGTATVDGAVLIALSCAAIPVVVAMTLLLAALRCVRPLRAYLTVQSVLFPLARPVLVGLAVLAGWGLVAGFAGWLVPAGLTLLLCLTLVTGPLGVGRGALLRPAPADWRTFWRFALPRSASAAMDAGAVWVGVLLTSVLAGPAEAGVFGAVGRYILAGQLAMQGLRVAVSPQLSRLLGQGRRATAATVHRQLTAWAVLLCWPVYLLLALHGAAFLAVFGADFAADGTVAMAVLAVAMLVNTGVGNVQSLLLMSGHSGLHLAATSAGLLVTVSLGLLMIPGHGATGAALAWAAGIVVENLIAYRTARVVVGQPLVDAPVLRAAGLVVLGVGGPALLGLLVSGRGPLGLAVAVGLPAAGCLGLLTLPRVRAGIGAALGQLRGREPAGPAVAPVPSKKGR